MAARAKIKECKVSCQAIAVPVSASTSYTSMPHFLVYPGQEGGAHRPACHPLQRPRRCPRGPRLQGRHCALPHLSPSSKFFFSVGATSLTARPSLTRPLLPPLHPPLKMSEIKDLKSQTKYKSVDEIDRKIKALEVRRRPSCATPCCPATGSSGKAFWL